MAEDLPYVDGRTATPEELRAEVARQSDPQVQRIEELRDDLASTVDELGSRLDVRSRFAQSLARARPVLMAIAALLGGVILLRRWRSRAGHRT
jgi:hypothetical protein